MLLSCAVSEPRAPVHPDEREEADAEAVVQTRAASVPPVVESSMREAESEAAFFELPVPGYGDAIVSVPADTRTARPVLVAAHGAGDKPMWQCQVWRAIVQDRGFVVCPRGTRMSWGIPGQDLGYFFRNHHALEKEVLAVLESFKDRFGDRIAPGPVVYAGYSQGGIMGALMVVKHPEVFQRLILVEGGEAEWDVPTATRFREGGGKRVLLVCGRHACQERARRSTWWLRRGGVGFRSELVPGAGHTYGGAVAERLLETFDWVVEGDDRWTNDVSSAP